MDESRQKQICVLGGGLGNQMFQYAANKVISNRNGRNLVICDHFLDKNKVARPFDLNMFSLIDHELKCDGRHNFLNPFSRIGRVLNAIHPRNQIFDERETLIAHSSKAKFYTYGYWQDLKYIDSESVISNIFRFQNDIIILCQDISKVLSKYNNIVALHIRRGDLVASGSRFCSEKYYVSSVRLIRDLLGKETKFLIFTDSPDATAFIKEIIWDDIIDIPTLTDFGKYNKAQIDFYLMSLCENFILSNSTFGWWASYLKYLTCKKTIVIYPKFWAGSMPKEVSLFPQGWISNE